MPNTLKFKPRPGPALLAALLVFPALGHAAAARVDFAVGEAKALAADGSSRPLAKGAEIASGDTIDTGSGRAQLRFSDGALVSLAPQTQFRIDNYRYEGRGDGSEKGFFSLLKGAMRTITGMVGRSNRDNYKVTTTVATIGIRGTEYSVAYGNSINVTTGEGVVEVCNGAGCLTLNSGETAHVASAQTRPSLINKRVEIPPPPPGPLPTFVAGNETGGEGRPANLIPPSPPSPAPMPVIPLASGPGGLGAAHITTGGSISAGLLGGNLTFAGTGELTQFADSTFPMMGYSGGTPAEFGADGIIGWGRWVGGVQTDSAGSPTSLASMNYVTALNTTPVTATSIVRGYASFASTAPVIVSASGSVVATGSPNSVTGTLSVNFPSLTGGGSLTYSLNIPVAGQAFSVNGSATQYSGAGFLGASSTITSTGSACTPACTGSIPFGDAIQGFFTGSAAERAGANYGFSSQLGQVSGAVVFK